MFLGKTLYSHSASLHPGVFNEYRQGGGGGGGGGGQGTLLWTNIPSRESGVNSFMLLKPG